VAFDLNLLGQAVDPGHRLRLSIGTAYWPWFWPSPEPVELTVYTGDGSHLSLPVRPPLGSDLDRDPFGPPEQAPGLRFQVLEVEPVKRTVARDPRSATTTIESNGDGNERTYYEDGDIEVSWRYLDRATIDDHDPLTAFVRCERSFGLARDPWRVRVQTTSTMTSDAESFLVDDLLEAFEGDRRVFAKAWSRRFPRDHV